MNLKQSDAVFSPTWLLIHKMVELLIMKQLKGLPNDQLAMRAYGAVAAFHEARTCPEDPLQHLHAICTAHLL